jgi:DNA polymerase-3 subunit delta
MPVYLYWGEDNYRIQQAIEKLKVQVLDPDWQAFNDERFSPEMTLIGLAQAMTAPLGNGERVVWLAETCLVHQCPDEWIKELEKTLRHLPDTTHLVLTSSNKPDGRLRSTKLLKDIAQTQEFSLAAAWDHEAIIKQITEQARARHLALHPKAVEALAMALGSDSRKIDLELEKLSLYLGSNQQVISEAMIADLVIESAHNPFQLARALSQGKLIQALETLAHLLTQNEPALRIVSVLVGQFRTWLWIRILVDQGEKDNKVIAQQAEVGNPNRIYFLRKEIQSLSAPCLYQSLKLLLDLEAKLKHGYPEQETFQLAIIEITTLFSSKHKS